MKLAVLAAAVALMAGGPAWSAKPVKVTVDDKQFLLDGKPFLIISGEMHYCRIPREYWRDRFRKAKALGCNAITTYTFWNLHEPKPGRYDFSGDLDVAAFTRMAQEEGLYVILRPGPYVCSEWDFGGYPAWLLKTGTVKVRSTDPAFLAACDRWLKRLGKELAFLQSTKGGPIIMVQVENEYGSFGSDRAFMEATRKQIIDAGFTVQLYTADGPDQIPDGSLPDLPAAFNFGGGARQAMRTVERNRPTGPRMCGEFWVGWFDHWGEPKSVIPPKPKADDLDYMLSRGVSVSLYMLHGGTNFAFTAGANDGTYRPDITSYDYDSPMDEASKPTPKYYAFRDVIRKYLPAGTVLPEVRAQAPVIEISGIELTETASLWDGLPKPVAKEEPLWMEALDQAWGAVLYRTKLPAGAGELRFEHVRDFATVFVNGKRVGELDRRLGQKSLTLADVQAGARLDVLVENCGRINFGPKLVDDRKGILDTVTFNSNALTGWEMFSLPFDKPHKQKYAPGGKADGPAFYRGSFTLEKTGDTWLDMRRRHKGLVWVNGHNLGRFWKVGPQQTLYVPGPWLKKGRNEVIVYDVNPIGKASLSSLPYPILDRLEAAAK